jgi:hypothetical protein
VNGERHLASHVFNVVVLVVGTIALVVLMQRLGVANARAIFADAGGGFAAILALDLASMACDAGAIHAFMRPEARMVSFARVLAAQASGRAINILTPGGALGEATKVTMLVGHAPHARVVSSIVLYNLATLYLSIAIVLVGVPLTALLVDLPGQLEVIVWAGFAALVALVIGLAVVVHRGALATALSAARGLRFVSRERARAWQTRLADIDRHLRELHADRSPGTRSGLALIGASRLLQSAATVVMLHIVGVELHVSLLVGVLSAGVLIGWISNVVPFGIGVADGSNYALFDVLGASGAHGVFVTMLGRARSLCLALVGLVVMAGGHTANRIAIARRNRRKAILAANHHLPG